MAAATATAGASTTATAVDVPELAECAEASLDRKDQAADTVDELVAINADVGSQFVRKDLAPLLCNLRRWGVRATASMMLEELKWPAIDAEKYGEARVPEVTKRQSMIAALVTNMDRFLNTVTMPSPDEHGFTEHGVAEMMAIIQLLRSELKRLAESELAKHVADKSGTDLLSALTLMWQRFPTYMCKLLEGPFSRFNKDKALCTMPGKPMNVQPTRLMEHTTHAPLHAFLSHIVEPRSKAITDAVVNVMNGCREGEEIAAMDLVTQMKEMWLQLGHVSKEKHTSWRYICPMKAGKAGSDRYHAAGSLYHDVFHVAVVSGVTEYSKAKAADCNTGDTSVSTLREWLLKAEQLVDKEVQLGTSVHSSTAARCLRIMQANLLEGPIADWVFGVDGGAHSGVLELFKEGRREDIGRVYRLYARIADTDDAGDLLDAAGDEEDRVSLADTYARKLAARFRTYLEGRLEPLVVQWMESRGKESANVSERMFVDKAVLVHREALDWIKQCVSLHSKRHEVEMRSALRKTFEWYMGTSKSGEFSDTAANTVAQFMSYLLKKAEPERVSTEVQTAHGSTDKYTLADLLWALAANTNDKDIFLECYKGKLADRLLNGDVKDDEAESRVLSWLKAHWSGAAQEVKVVVTMWTEVKSDSAIQASDDMAKARRDELGGEEPFPIKCLVLADKWPTRLFTELRSPKFEWAAPEPLVGTATLLIKHFAAHAAGKKLTMAYSQGRAIMALVRGDGVTQYQALVSTPMAIVMLTLVELGGEATIDEVLGKCGVPKEVRPPVMAAVMGALVCRIKRKPPMKAYPPLLVVTPKVPAAGAGPSAADEPEQGKGKSKRKVKAKLHLDDTLALPPDTAKFGRTDKQDWGGRTDALSVRVKDITYSRKAPTVNPEHRNHMVDAAIVRIMKARGKLKQQELLGQVCEQVKMFVAQPRFVKRRVEQLIEREYLAREEEEMGMLKYWA